MAAANRLACGDEVSPGNHSFSILREVQLSAMRGNFVTRPCDAVESGGGWDHGIWRWSVLYL